MKARCAALLLALALLLPGIARAVEPNEILADPALEARARAISADLRCMVCQNESIDESHADLARDLRQFVRERLVAGDSDGAIKQSLRARFGDFILLKPPVQGSTLLLWGTPALALALGAAGAFWAFRRRPVVVDRALDPSEERRLRDLLGPG